MASASKFSEKLSLLVNSSLNRNDHMIFKDYVNPEMKGYEIPSYTKYSENVLEKYMDRIVSTSTKVRLSEKDMKDIAKRPAFASYKFMNDFAFTDLILRLNDCVTADDFVDFTYIRLPSASEIELILEEERTSNATII